jgi:hypothetical protein
MRVSPFVGQEPTDHGHRHNPRADLEKDKPATMQYIMEQLGSTEKRTPPNWVLDLFKTDKAIVEGAV